jgi:hypothetical protein
LREIIALPLEWLLVEVFVNAIRKSYQGALVATATNFGGTNAPCSRGFRQGKIAPLS